jgi:putative ABC transport system permease protein
MAGLSQNLRYALRQLRKLPGFSITALLTLASGIGANTAIFTVACSTLLAPLPDPKPDELVIVRSKVQTSHNSVYAGDFDDWRNQSTAFSALNAWTGRIKFQLGCNLLPAEGKLGQEHVVVLMNKLWKKLGSDPNSIGKSNRVDGPPLEGAGFGRPFTIAGAAEISDPSQRPGAAFGMVEAALPASWVPARRAASIDPMDALLAE